MGVIKKGPARTIRGIRTSIPSGYVLGRLSAGDGATELIHMTALNGALSSPGNGGSGGGGGGGGTTRPPAPTPPADPAAVFIQKDIGDETTAITAGTGKKTFRMPADMTVSEIRASLTTAQATGSIFTLDVKKAGSTILSTLLTIDNTETTSTSAATAAVISDATLPDDSEMRIDVTQVGDGTATGLKVTFIGGSLYPFSSPSLDFSDLRNSQYIGVA